MRLTKRWPGVVGGVIALVAMAGWFLLPRPPEAVEAPKGSIYYTGPMMQKGSKGVYGTIDGRSATQAEADKAVAEFQNRVASSDSKSQQEIKP